MSSEMPMNHPQSIWQNQSTEAFKMSADYLRNRAVAHQRAARHSALLAGMIGLLLCAWFGWGATRAHDVASRAGLGLLSAWSVYYAWQGYKWIWPRRLRAEATLNNTLRYYRSELEKQRDYAQHIWVRGGLLVCLLGIAIFLLPYAMRAFRNPRLVLNFVPLFVLAAVWLAVFIPSRKRRRQKLEEEIAKLREFEIQHLS